MYNLHTLAHAHENSTQLPQSGYQARAALAYHSKNAEDKPIPGIALGGEALPLERGLTLDDLQLTGHYNSNQHYSVSVKLSAHSHSGTEDLILENYWLTWNIEDYVANGLVELGRNSTEVTHTANYHASESWFSEAPLLSDAFFGRHFDDLGLRVKGRKGATAFGLELWNGDNWPATRGSGAGSVFIKFEPSWQTATMALGAWAMRGRAKNRQDNRFNGDHNHARANTQATAAGIYYSGSNNLLGVYAKLSYGLGDASAYTEAEWIQQQGDGLIRENNGQQSDIQSTYEGARWLLGLALFNHSIHLQYEQIVLENIFLNSVNGIFLEQTGLQNNGLEPSKWMAAWQWQMHPNFSARATWVRDKTVSEQSNSRASLGIIWVERF